MRFYNCVFVLAVTACVDTEDTVATEADELVVTCGGAVQSIGALVDDAMTAYADKVPVADLPRVRAYLRARTKGAHNLPLDDADTFALGNVDDLVEVYEESPSAVAWLATTEPAPTPAPSNCGPGWSWPEVPTYCQSSFNQKGGCFDTDPDHNCRTWIVKLGGHCEINASCTAPRK